MNPRPWIYVSGIATLLLVATCSVALAEPKVELTITGVSGPAAHEWGKALANSPFQRVRVIGGKPSAPSIEQSGSEASDVYRVTGIIDRQNRLRVPGASFGISDRVQMAEWIRALPGRQDADGAVASRLAFGMTADQLVGVTDELSRIVHEPTDGQTVRSVVSRMQRLAGTPVILDNGVAAAIPPGERVREELSGLSVGTVMASVLRPQGLVMVPQARDGTTRLVIRSAREVSEHWPVGWPATGAPHEHVPKLHEFLEVEIIETPLSESVAAIQGRLEIPVLYDQNGMARQRIDPDRKLVSFPAKRTFYSRILKNLLFQAKLKYEVRLDEADNPFLWISPLKSNDDE